MDREGTGAAAHAMGPRAGRAFPRCGDLHFGFARARCPDCRLLLDRPELLQTQARASAYGPVDVLYPMIVDLEQFLTLKRMFRQAADELAVGQLRHGVMFEVPSACLEAQQLLEAADFGSIGTNDLIQYLFAVDRNNELVAYDYTPDRSVFWSVLSQIAAAAAETGRTVSVCGEMASNPQFLHKLMGTVLTRLGVSPRHIPQLLPIR